jgi:hypothetical protein
MLLVVPAYGAPGAAVLVVLTAAAGLALLLLRTRTWMGGRLVEYLLPTAADVRWLARSMRNRTVA